MISHIEAIIPDALISYFDELELPEGVRVAYPNVSFTPNNEHPYVRLSVFKNNPIQNLIGFSKGPIRKGIFQVSLFWPEGEGTNKSAELVGIISDHFSRGTKIIKNNSVIRIDEEPKVSSDSQEKGWLLTPIYINWIVYP